VMNKKGECKWYVCCPMKEYYEKGLLEAHWVHEYCFGKFNECSRYYLEEKGEWHPNWMLPDGSLDERLRDAK
jgi:hypothetical protein